MSELRSVRLQMYNDYSMINGLAKAGPLAKEVIVLGIPTLTITDFISLYGLVKSYGTGHGAGIKPIVGVDFHVRSELSDDELTQLTVLAANNTGYQNLTLLISKAYQHGYGAEGPVIDRDWSVELKEGLISPSDGCMDDVERNLLRGNSTLVDECVAFYEEYFPNYYSLELTHTGRQDEESYLHAAVALTETRGLLVVATNDVRLLETGDPDAYEIHVVIHDGFILGGPKRPCNYSSQQYMRNKDEMCELFSDIPEALQNTVEVTRHCNATVRLGEYLLPQFPTGDIATENFLVVKSREDLGECLEFSFPDPEVRAQKRPPYDKRLEVEFKAINQTGFPGCSLIVVESIQWLRSNGIPVDSGRGFGADSLVVYALRIIDLDPLEFDLLFEHFLNPERVSMPDFDVDFCMEKRDRVIKHVAEMYGRDTVSQITTFGAMTAKAAIHDVGHVLGHPHGFVGHTSKLVPPDPGMTLAKAFEVEPQLPEIYEADEEVKALIDMARELEGVARNVGKHTDGMVIVLTKTADFAPLYCNEQGLHPVTQFDKNDVEYAGLVKFDFLGLYTLTIISQALETVNTHREKNGEPPLDTAAISLDDRKSFDMLQHSETTTVFQLRSCGMENLIKRLQLDCLEDMVVLVVLFYPGPLQSGMVDSSIDREHGRREISYPDVQWQHECLKPVPEPTYDTILYQEQIMQIAQRLSGCTPSSADILCHTMGRKELEEMAKQRGTFKEGVKKCGVGGELAMKIFDPVEKFAGYGFNESYSTAYTLASCQTPWLKAHYPAEFMAAVMTADMDNTEKVVGPVDECWHMRLKILPPDINSGLYHFHVSDDGEIVYDIGAIKGVGEGPIETIIEVCNEGGYFREPFDLYTRMDIKKLNRRVLEKLVIFGAFGRLDPHRTALMNSLDGVLKAADQYAKAEAIGQADMFGVLTEEPERVGQPYTNCQPWSEQVVLGDERETLGLYLTGHPISQHLKEIEHYIGGYRLKDMHPTERGKVTAAVGLVIATQIMVTKRDNRIGICTPDDRSGCLEVTLFTDTLGKYRQLLEKDRIPIVSGQVSFDNFSGGFKMMAHEVMDIDEARGKYARGFAISLTDRQVDNQLLN